MNERQEGAADGKTVRSPMFVHSSSMDTTGIFDNDVVQMKMLPKSMANNFYITEVLTEDNYILLFTSAL